MSNEAKRAYRKAVQKSYNNSSKKQKSQILNEFCNVCNYSRKHAIKILSMNPMPMNVRPLKRPIGAPKTYSKEATKRLIELWQLIQYPCSVHLKQMITNWLPYDLDTPEEAKIQLYTMSESTIERHLKPTKKKRPKGKSTTTPPKVKSQIPLKLCKDDDRKTIGYFEADTVAHCGNALAGLFAWSLTMTDLHTVWTENRATLSKEAEQITNAVQNIEENLPFKIIGFSTDHGSEFINETLQRYLILDT